jgi:hypothetical protein
LTESDTHDWFLRGWRRFNVTLENRTVARRFRFIGGSTQRIVRAPVAAKRGSRSMTAPAGVDSNDLTAPKMTPAVASDLPYAMASLA